MSGADDIRARFENAEGVDQVEGLEPPAISPPDGPPPDGPPPTPPEEPGDPRRHDPERLAKIEQAADQPLNDYGNGQRFVIHFGEDVMFVPRVGWFTWSGKVWEKDQDQLGVRSRAQRIWSLVEDEILFIKPTEKEKVLLAENRRLLKRQAELEEVPAADRPEDHADQLGAVQARLKSIESSLKDHKSKIGRRLTHAKNAGNKGPIDHMLVESTTDLAVAFEALDTGELDINTTSGLLRFSVADLREMGAGRTARVDVIPHERDQRLSKMIPVEYDPEAVAPRWDAFLERIQPDREMREFLKRWHGLSMTARKMQRLAFYYGSGANGKSVLVDLMARIMAGYSASLRIESLTGTNRRGGGEATPDLIPLLGARFVRTSEPDQGEKLQEGLIKQLTGGEPIPVRPNYGEQIDLDPRFKLTISGNHKPDIRGTDDGIWRRVMLVPFDVMIPESERDEDLGEKLWQERQGVFRWMVEGLIDYLEMGLCPPEAVVVATDEYREESDPIGVFLVQCCQISGDGRDSILTSELTDAFNYYMLERGMNTWKPGTFTKQLSEKSRRWKHPETGKQVQKGKSNLSQYTGLRFTDAFRKRLQEAKRDKDGRPIGVGSPASPDPSGW